MTIRFIDAAKFFIGERHQIDAFEYLQAHTSPQVIEEFERRYRNKISQSLSYKIPPQAIKIIKEFEGFYSKAYYDPLTGGLPITIGWGSTRRRDGSRFMIGNTISEKEAEDLLYFQLESEFLPELEKIPHWNQMNDEMKSALFSFAYNLGARFYGSSGFNTISRVLKNKDWTQVPGALLLYVNPGTNVEAGLRRRRTAEGKLWSEGFKKI